MLHSGQAEPSDGSGTGGKDDVEDDEEDDAGAGDAGWREGEDRPVDEGDAGGIWPWYSNQPA